MIEASIIQIGYMSSYSRLQQDYRHMDGFRCQYIDEAMLQLLKQKSTREDPGEYLGLYWMETNYGQNKKKETDDLAELKAEKAFWKSHDVWPDYEKTCSSLWNDLECFPIMGLAREGYENSLKDSLSYVDTWGAERTYGGKRSHEGCDIIPQKQESDLYPVVSITDGIVTKKGWLEKGGYRVGVTTSHHVFFYYAHLSSYGDIEVGDHIKAGDILGYMGDTGYGTVEGTRGKFPVHLHLGVYLEYQKEEISVNPYYMLRYLEEKKVLWMK